MISSYGIYLVFVLIFLLLAILNKSFLTVTNLINILKQTSTVSVVAIGMTFTLICGGLDLSAGSVIALAAVCSAKFGLPGAAPLIVPLVVAIGIGVVCGFINGLFVAKGGVPAFIATLGSRRQRAAWRFW